VVTQEKVYEGRISCKEGSRVLKGSVWVRSDVDEF
jgi:hypothetical protein